MRKVFDLTLCALFVLAIGFRLAHATWKPEYASLPPEVIDWYQQAKLTQAAKARLGFTYCCDHADVVRTKFAVNRVDGADEWFYEDTPGHLKKVPDDVTHWDEHAPGGQPTLFVFAGKETCFYPGAEGG